MCSRWVLVGSLPVYGWGFATDRHEHGAYRPFARTWREAKWFASQEGAEAWLVGMLAFGPET